MLYIFCKGIPIQKRGMSLGYILCYWSHDYSHALCEQPKKNCDPCDFEAMTAGNFPHRDCKSK